MYAKGNGVKKESSKAAIIYNKACKLGNKKACGYTKDFK